MIFYFKTSCKSIKLWSKILPFLSKSSRLLFLYLICSTNLTRETRLIGHKAISQELIMNVEQINEKEANATTITFCLSQFIYLCDLWFIWYWSPYLSEKCSLGKFSLFLHGWMSSLSDYAQSLFPFFSQAMAMQTLPVSLFN